MKKAIWFIIYAVSILILGWITLSILNVWGHNLGASAIAAWNFFKILTKTP